MVIYRYVAKDQQGQVHKGKVEAQGTEQAARVLRERKYVVISLKPIHSGMALFEGIMGRVRLADVVTFTRQLATMIAAGLPLTEALTILRPQNKPRFGQVIAEVLRDVQGGVSLADAFQKHEVFPKVYVALIRVGEAAGILDTVMGRLADNLERKQEFRAKTKGALIYPAIVLIGMVAVAFIMMVFVIPQLSQLYQDFGAELPVPTQILLSISGIVSRFWYLVLAAVFGATLFFRVWRKTPAGAYQYDQWMLRLPVFGKLKTKMVMAEFTRTLSLLVASGISILEALTIVADSLESEVIARAIKSGASEVEKGVSLAETLARREVFPAIVPQMISVGEETGKLDEVLLKVSRYFETEAEQEIKNLTTAMEPLIMILLGVGVGFLITAIILPIYDLTSQF